MNYSNWVVLLVWLVLLYGNGLVFFLRGFLLTRREIQVKSSISDGTSCCLPAKYKQVIILIVDALRYDFVAHKNISNTTKEMYHNNFPIVNQLLRDNPENTLLYQFIADPPTTTLQRLKGLTTGSLPTFIDLSSNFASDELIEDNIISQLTSLNMNLTFMGDDTWMGLFPASFQRSYPFPSFDVWDIDTVDRGVESHLFTEMNDSNWNLLVAHCLGVDHVGHRYGPHHPTMPLKLSQMNNIIERIVNSMNPLSLLLVMGDHGMTRSGDHGGDSDDEVQAGLFAYSPRLRIKHKADSPAIVSQVDIVPTLALLFGIPIPYSNLGSVILDLVYPHHLNKDSELEFYCDALYLNVKQIWRYLLNYNAELAFPREGFQRLNLQSEKIKLAYQTLKHSDPQQFVNMCQSFLAEAKEMCRTIWAKFDLKFITTGLAIFFGALILHTACVLFENPFPSWTIFVGIIGAITSLLFQSEVLAAVVCLIPIVMLLAAPRKLKHLHDLTLFVPLILAGSYTSNSFVVQEPYVVMYLTQSIIWVPWLMRRSLKGLPFLVVLSLASRLGLTFFRCREEQLPDCAVFNLHRNLTSLSDTGFIVIFRILVASGSILASYLLLRRYLIIGKRIVYLVLLVWSHWILQAIATVVDLNSKMLTFLPQLSYISFLLMLLHQLHSKYTSYCAKASSVVLLSTTVALLLAGDGLAPGILLTLLSLVCLMQLNPCAKEFWLLYSMLSLQGFFATGHHTSLANIPWETAFVGFSHSNSPSLLANLLPALLVSYSTAFSLFLHAVALPLVALSSARKYNEAPKSSLVEGSYYYLLFHAIRLFSCMGAAAIHRRHLMVWKIFAPRLLYELLFALYTSVGLVASIVLHQLSAM